MASFAGRGSTLLGRLTKRVQLDRDRYTMWVGGMSNVVSAGKKD
jgi:hypothetical protein